eukprot:660879-Hanusia_phi.AAC.2
MVVRKLRLPCSAPHPAPGRSLWTWRSIRRSSRPPPPLLTLCQFASIFGAPRIAGDDGPGELLQPFEDGLTWNVRWSKTGGESRGGEEAEEGGRSGGQLLHRRIQVVSPEGRSARHRQELCGPDLPLGMRRWREKGGRWRKLRQRIEGGGGGGLSDLTGACRMIEGRCCEDMEEGRGWGG